MTLPGHEDWRPWPPPASQKTEIQVEETGFDDRPFPVVAGREGRGWVYEATGYEVGNSPRWRPLAVETSSPWAAAHRAAYETCVALLDGLRERIDNMGHHHATEMTVAQLTGLAKRLSAPEADADSPRSAGREDSLERVAASLAAVGEIRLRWSIEDDWVAVEDRAEDSVSLSIDLDLGGVIGVLERIRETAKRGRAEELEAAGNDQNRMRWLAEFLPVRVELDDGTIVWSVEGDRVAAQYASGLKVRRGDFVIWRHGKHERRGKVLGLYFFESGAELCVETGTGTSHALRADKVLRVGPKAHSAEAADGPACCVLISLVASRKRALRHRRSRKRR